MGWLSKLFKSNDGPPVEKRTLMNMKVGDMVTYELEDYQIVGKLIFNDHGFQWFEYQLESTDRTFWLSVEMDDELEVSIYEKVQHKVSEPVPKKIELEGTVYYLDEKGSANVHGQGRSANVSGHTVRYFDFCDEEEDHYLSVEIWGSEVEVSTGIPANDYDFTIIAGS
jgi:hypothetical protein